MDATKTEDLGFAKVDLARRARQGAGEVVYGEGKSAMQIAAILRTLSSHGQTPAMVTRLDEVKAMAVERLVDGDFEYFKEARFARLGWKEAKKKNRATGRGKTAGYIAVACAGTSDIAVAEEAALTAETLGCKVERVYDVGVAGLHRLLEKREVLEKARVVIAVAGMEGALASVIGGLVASPVIAVPTSVGYGASFGGVAALLAMLNSCAAGVACVNIDNGFGAGFMAAKILRVASF